MRRNLWVPLLLVAGLIVTGVACDDSASQTTPAAANTSNPPSQTDGGTAPKAAPISTERISLDGVVNGSVSLTRNFYFVIDGSGSMNGSIGGGKTRLDGAKAAVEAFMKQVPDDANLGLYVFDGGGSKEVVPLGSNNRAAFLTAVKKMWGGGGTPLKESIITGTDKLVEQYKKQLGYGEFRLIVVTDGEADGIATAGKHAEKFGIPIYTIGFYLGAEHELRKYSVSYRAADSPEDLRKALEETLAESGDFDASTPPGK